MPKGPMPSRHQFPDFLEEEERLRLLDWAFSQRGRFRPSAVLGAGTKVQSQPWRRYHSAVSLRPVGVRMLGDQSAGGGCLSAAATQSGWQK